MVEIESESLQVENIVGDFTCAGDYATVWDTASLTSSSSSSYAEIAEITELAEIAAIAALADLFQDQVSNNLIFSW